MAGCVTGAPPPPPPPEDSQAERSPGPHAVDAEAAVIAAILTEPAAYDDVAEVLTADDFAVEQLRAVYTAIEACDATGRPVDAITVADELVRRGDDGKVGGRAALERIMARAGSVEHTASHARIVADKALLRRVLTAGRHITATALDSHSDGQSALTEAERTVFAVGEGREPSGLTTMAQAVARTNEEIARAASADIIGHPTGMPTVDALTSGLQPGQLWVVGARPGGGKSAWSLAVASHVADATGLAVPFFSYEMGVTELTVRLLANRSGVDGQLLRRGRIPPAQSRKVAAAASQLANSTLLLDEHPSETIEGLRSVLRRLARRKEIAAVFVDYLQLIASPDAGRGDNRTVEIGRISRGLKLLAAEIGVPVVAMSQLSRKTEERGSRPQLSDLRESGSIEQDASLVALLHRRIHTDPAADPRDLDIIIAKHRNGPTGTIRARWDQSTSSFTDLGTEHDM